MDMAHRATRRKVAGFSKAIAILILASAWMASAQEYLSVTSTTDGQGLFSYTFGLGSPSYVWAVSPGAGDIQLQSYGILDVISPPGWTATVDANDYITWQPTSDTFYLGQPSLTFSVLSSYTGSILYDQWTEPDPVYPGGFVIGVICTMPDDQPIVGGYETFTFLGPQVVPEPSSLALVGFSLLLMKPTRRLLCQCFPRQTR
jgi:hypothetical protein